MKSQIEGKQKEVKHTDKHKETRLFKVKQETTKTGQNKPGKIQIKNQWKSKN